VRIPKGAFTLVKEVARHLLRRPVVGLVAYALNEHGEVLLIRRGDTGEWAMAGGTLEWNETLRGSLDRELEEEAGVRVLEQGPLLGIYSAPWRDPRFHAVTIVVGAKVSAIEKPPMNPLEIFEARFFKPTELPSPISHGQGEMLERAIKGAAHWE
jgi:8-oxo-dGTP diphosphatase